MTVDDIRKLSPEQMNRIAEIRSEIEALELEMDGILKGDKPRRSSKPKAKKKPARKPNPTPEAKTTAEPAPAAIAEAASPIAALGSRSAAAADSTDKASATPTEEPPVQTGGVLSRLALPKMGSPPSTELDS